MLQLIKKIRFYAAILFDRQTPWPVKLILVAAALYVILPVDLISDMVPLVGWIDDVTLGTFLVALAVRLVPEQVAARVSQKIYGKS